MSIETPGPLLEPCRGGMSIANLKSTIVYTILLGYTSGFFGRDIQRIMLDAWI